jgi:hypothetical protein
VVFIKRLQIEAKKSKSQSFFRKEFGFNNEKINAFIQVKHFTINNIKKKEYLYVFN